MKAHGPSARFSRFRNADRQTEVAGFLRTALMTMVRSVPVGIWVDQDLRARFPDLRAAQEQAIRR